MGIVMMMVKMLMVKMMVKMMKVMKITFPGDLLTCLC